MLEWLLSNQLLRPGSLIGFDDWWAVPCNHWTKHGKLLSPFDYGEGLATKEIVKKYGLRLACVAGPCKPPPSTTACHVHNNFGVIFLLQAVPDEPQGIGSTDFEFQELQQREWMNASTVCQSLRDMYG